MHIICVHVHLYTCTTVLLVLVSSEAYKGTATYTCVTGYAVGNNSFLNRIQVRQCSSDGIWLPDVLQSCVRVACPLPPPVDNGEVNKKSGRFLYVASIHSIYAIHGIIVSFQ